MKKFFTALMVVLSLSTVSLSMTGCDDNNGLEEVGEGIEDAVD